MRTSDLLRFLSLAALFGGSFLFMRIAAPHFGALATAELRVLIAGAVLAAYTLLARRPLLAAQHWRGFLVVGAFNTGIPFVLFAYAAIHLPTGYSAILNSLMPIWAAFFSAFMLGERLSWRVFAGVAAGMAGVALLVQLGPVALDREVVLAALACIAATVCYGFAGTYTKKHLAGLPAHGAAASTMLFAALVLAPFAAVSLPAGMPPAGAWLAVAALALFCSALAFFLYYQLIARIGATQISAVTFLLPAFGIFWGWLFLGEPVTPAMLGGFMLVGVAAGLVLGIGPFRNFS
ncbi:MAG: DMT family transporter [Gammaproteobacteria bacterium]|nr:DMT family transporter [Gammaproteobacteria bacterium]